MLDRLLEETGKDESSSIELASGYFNPTDKISKQLGGSKGKVQVLASSPTANRFLGDGYIKTQIPKFYRFYESQFMRKYPNVEVFEYVRPDWSFHAKGLWISDNGNPFLSVIGSSNYSNRSMNRDTECQFYIFSECEGLNEKFREETDYLFHMTPQMTLEKIKEDKKMRLGPIR